MRPTVSSIILRRDQLHEAGSVMILQGYHDWDAVYRDIVAAVLLDAIAQRKDAAQAGPGVIS
jgi:hypothetical protein